MTNSTTGLTTVFATHSLSIYLPMYLSIYQWIYLYLPVFLYKTFSKYRQNSMAECKLKSEFSPFSLCQGQILHCRLESICFRKFLVVFFYVFSDSVFLQKAKIIHI